MHRDPQGGWSTLNSAPPSCPAPSTSEAPEVVGVGVVALRVGLQRGHAALKFLGLAQAVAGLSRNTAQWVF